jgi:hypothetical protein
MKKEYLIIVGLVASFAVGFYLNPVLEKKNQQMITA